MAGDGYTELRWQPNTEPDLLGYEVYRKLATQPDSAYVKISSQVVIGTRYRDDGAGNGVTYYYRITAVDDAGP